MYKKYPKVKEIFLLLGAGTFLAGSLLMPGLPAIVKPLIDERRRLEEKEWQKYDIWRLRSVLRRLHRLKMIDVVETQQGYEVALTEKGKQRVLKYSLESMKLVTDNWDRRWRIIVYDISESKREARKFFQTVLRKLQFLQLQKSVYLTPFECKNEIEYVRQICNIGEEVSILTVSGLENEEVYKGYFGLE
jgi:CRISPR-associated endonuclease Cas2